jgi:hypothetical protein
VPAQGSPLAREIIGRGAAYADYDGDGDVDILLTANQGPAYLLRNDIPRQAHVVRLKTQGSRSNRDGIGAKVRVHTPSGVLQKMVRTGSSYLSQSELPLTFGLGESTAVEKIEVIWPSGIVDEVANVAVDTTLLVQEGQGASQAVIPVAQ